VHQIALARLRCLVSSQVGPAPDALHRLTYGLFPQAYARLRRRAAASCATSTSRPWRKKTCKPPPRTQVMQYGCELGQRLDGSQSNRCGLRTHQGDRTYASVSWKRRRPTRGGRLLPHCCIVAHAGPTLNFCSGWRPTESGSVSAGERERGGVLSHGKRAAVQSRGFDAARACGCSRRRAYARVAQGPRSLSADAGTSARQRDESDDPDDVDREYGDAVDTESRVLLGGPEQQPSHVDDREQRPKAGEVDV